MNKTFQHTFLTYPSAVFFSLMLGGLGLGAGIYRYVIYATFESSPFLAAMAFFSLAIWLFAKKTTVQIHQDPFLFLVTQTAPEKEVIRYQDGHEFSFSSRENANDMIFFRAAMKLRKFFTDCLFCLGRWL